MKTHTEELQIAKAIRKPNRQRKWSSIGTRNSDALDLESKVFAKKTAIEIARSLSAPPSAAAVANRRRSARQCQYQSGGQKAGMTACAMSAVRRSVIYPATESSRLPLLQREKEQRHTGPERVHPPSSRAMTTTVL
jgi:hypothetical protein